MALELENITFKNIIKNINYSFENGKIYSILSSSEKERATIGKILSLLEDNYEGKIKNTSKIGYVYSNPQDMFICNTVYEELNLCLKNSNYKKETRDKKITFVLDILHLSKDILNANPSNLSSGEKKLLSIAVGLITNPKVLILNEPELYLDDFHKRNLIKILKKISKKYDKIIIIITSDVLFCYDVCDTYILLNKGEITKTANKKDLVNISDELNNASLKIPEILNFINYANKKNIYLDKTYDIKELMKDVYRNVKWCSNREIFKK